jgi:hypothetical protein
MEQEEAAVTRQWSCNRGALAVDICATTEEPREPAFSVWFLPRLCDGHRQVSHQPMVSSSFFVIIPFYLQSVPVHSANCVKTYTVARRRVLSSALLHLGSLLGCLGVC